MKVLPQKGIAQSTKLKIYRAIGLSTLLYVYETWTLYRQYTKQLDQFHSRSLCMIMNICWKDSITNQEVLDRAGSTSTESMLLKVQMRWTGHVV